MSTHPRDHELRAFALPTLGDDDAVAVALHLDDCPSCSHRAAQLDPLASAFAAVPALNAPPSLVPAVLTEVARPARWLTPELALGAAFLVAAVALVIATVDPLDGMVQLGVLLDVTEDVARDLGHALVTSGTAVIGTLVAVVALGAATLAQPRLGEPA